MFELRSPGQAKALVLVAILLAAGTWPCAAAGPVAMVTDVVGAATGGGGQTVQLLDELGEGAVVELEADAGLTLVFFDSGAEYTFSGPARIVLSADDAAADEGSGPTVRHLLAAGGDAVRINPSGKAQASVMMRGDDPDASLTLLAPISPSILDRRPRFAWEALAGDARYRFELVDENLVTVAQATVGGSSFELPSGLELADGALYTWEVETRTPTGVRVANWGMFTVATSAQREHVNALRGRDDASFSERLVFAVWLEQNGFADEADREWSRLRAERPEIELPERQR